MSLVLLIDGHSILNRAFYGIPIMTNHEGIHTNAVYGFVQTLQSTIEELAPAYVGVAFDVKAPTFRHKLYDAYKGNRKPAQPEFREQVDLMKELLVAMRVPIFTLEGYEADDILGTLAKRFRREGHEVVILSGDRDLLQLVEEGIIIRQPKTVKGVTTVKNYDANLVKEDLGVWPEEIIDWKALCGDSSDNIEGVPGIGEKGASAIISEYHSIENAYANVDQIRPARAQNALREHYDAAEFAKKLVTIDTQAPIAYELPNESFDTIFTKEAYPILVRLELRKLLSHYEKQPVETITDPADSFILVEEEEELQAVLRNLEEEIGLAGILEAEELLGIAVTDAKSTHVALVGNTLSQARLKEAMRELTTTHHAYVMDLKSLLDAGDFLKNGRIEDVGIIAYLVNPILDAYTYDSIALEQLNMTLPDRKTLMHKQSLQSLRLFEPQSLIKLIGYEAYVAYHTREALYGCLCGLGEEALYREIELPIVHILRQMEREGIGVNRQALADYGNMLAKKIAELESTIYEAAGTKFNIHSPKQLGEILFERLALPYGKKTKTGYSTAADVLEKLSMEYPIVKDILEYRTVSKLKSTYADGLDDFIREDGRIHGVFNQTVTATGRLSSSDPNLQNIPIRMELGRQIRKLFVPKDGYVFVDADYSQIELRILAHMSQDESLIQAYKEDSDIHRITASKVFHVPIEEVTSAMRSNAKAVNFGIVYGISSFGLSNNLSISREEASEYIKNYFATFPRLKAYQEELVEYAKEHGQAVTLYGRVRPIPEIKETNFMRRQFGERIAMNSPLQGTAADIIKLAMIRVDHRLKAEGLHSKLILQIHDELLIEALKEEADAVRQILKEEMMQAASLRVPLEVDVHEGKDWYEAK